ncbi:MAG: FeoB-associated Cys-rich membrane protein [Treponemataceae bacterium]|nr:FeoB-associated Cys-rich membrane protein [Treponemataceae bacterium]
MATLLTIAIIILLVALVLTYLIKKHQAARKSGTPTCIGCSSCSKCSQCSSKKSEKPCEGVD